jgi:hypothetical protein
MKQKVLQIINKNLIHFSGPSSLISQNSNHVIPYKLGFMQNRLSG